MEVWVFGWMGIKVCKKKVRSKCGKWWKIDIVPVVVIDEERGKYAQNMVHIGLNKLFGGQHKK